MLVKNQRSKKQPQDGASEVPLQHLHQAHVSPFVDEETRGEGDTKPQTVAYACVGTKNSAVLRLALTPVPSRTSSKSTKDQCLQNGP